MLPVDPTIASSRIVLALVGQYHYVSLEPQEDYTPGSTVIACSEEKQAEDGCKLRMYCTSDLGVHYWKLLTYDFFGHALISIFYTPGLDTQLQQDMATITEIIHSRSEDKQTDEDREQAEDELTLEHQVELRGLTYETCLQREDIDEGADDTLSVAPGGGKTPMSITKDEFFEEMFNPTKYPSGEGGLKTPRDTKLTVRKYFNQRLLDADGRFGKDVEYLFTAQYMVEDKQVHDAENIAMRQAQGRRHIGAVLTAGSVKNKEVLRQMVQRDDAYKFLKQVRGSPAYFQKVQYEVLALIRQLGLPTWFLTLSAADMQWPDVIQTIAR